MILSLLALIACQTAPDAPQSAKTPDTVEECPAGRAHTVEAQGAADDVVVQTPSGALVAPWVQFRVDQITIRCPDEGGTLTVVWRD